ncbi:MAG: hypothetical protein ISP10_04090 [Aeromicrobium sp.]|nr:hypothetical protein [Aeromicrobium sp.]
MARRPAWMDVSVIAIVVIALAGIVTPVCAMPECDATSLSACSSVAPACGECDDSTVVMKHQPDEALSADAVRTADTVATPAVVPAQAACTVVSLAVIEPAITASPPPRDPLGVRLTI